MSRPAGSAVSASSTSISWPRNGSFLPCERAEAKNRTLRRREVALLQQRAHHLADLAGRADYPDVAPICSASRSRVHDRLLFAAEAERLVQRRDGLVQLSVLDQHRDSDLRGGDQVDVHADLGERLAERRGDAGVAAHARTDQRHLADVVVVEHLGEADLVLQRGELLHRAGPAVARAGERDVGLAVLDLGDVLQHHVDVHVGVGDGAEHLGRVAGNVGQRRRR